MARSGIEYIPVEVGVLDTDDKIYALVTEAAADDSGLLDDASMAAFGRWVALLGQIYAEGYYIKLDGRKAARIARKLGFSSADDLILFIERCVELDLFDAELWESEHVLTSSGIQDRYSAAKKRSKGGLEGPYVLSAKSADTCGQTRTLADKRGHLRTNADNCPQMSAPYIREEEDEDKLREEDEEERSSSSVEDDEKPSGLAMLGCMAKREPAKLFSDSQGNNFNLRIAAIQSSYELTGGQDFKQFMGRVAGLCAPGCRGHPGQTSECFGCIMRSLDKFDRSKGADPWPLTKRVLEQDRRWVDG